MFDYRLTDEQVALQQLAHEFAEKEIRPIGLELDHNPDPTLNEIQEGISGNFCRCTGYTKIFESIDAAAKSMKGGK